MRVYLADLGHNQLTISSDVYPLGVANLATYLESKVKGNGRLDVSIFREPDELRTAIDSAPPDVLGLSSYAWNHNLSRWMARYAKAKDRSVLTVIGGPNFPLTREEQQTYLRTLTEIDVASRGPTYEGERAILNLVQRFVDVGGSIEGLMEEPIPANLWIDKRTGDFVHGGEIPRMLDLDEIPSPYLSGLMDPFYDSGYFPMLQISRGCPFTCAFCNSAASDNNKVFRHSVDNVKADLLHIAKRVKPETPACFADDNFGMYPWDEEVADYIHHLQDEFGWPQYIRTTTGKNRGDRIIKVMRKVRGSLPMTSAVQSLNPVVLKNIKRDNISLDTYKEIQDEVLAQGMQAYGELILCLPGETKESVLDAMDRLLTTGVKRISAHQLMLLHGAPLANPESRQKHQFDTRFRVVARNISEYSGDKILETEEIVVATPTFTFDDYLDVRVFHLLMTIFYYEGNFEEGFKLAEQMGVKPFDLIMALHQNLDLAPEPFKKTIDDFIRESHEELFETEEECVAWGQEHFAELLSGQVGGNLLSKYSMLGRFFTTPEAIDFLERGIEAARGGGVDDETRQLLESVIDYLRAVMLYSPFEASLARTPSWRTWSNVEAWRDEGYEKPLGEYRFEEQAILPTHIRGDVRDLIENRIRTFGDHPSGLGKFTRTMFARDLRRDIASAEA
ncbi:MAG: cobalamin-dependent protein [Acidobacteriota bacterium]|nr:cobalamin-dependent protein [Acidobacteriota bacterium]